MYGNERNETGRDESWKVLKKDPLISCEIKWSPNHRLYLVVELWEQNPCKEQKILPLEQ